MAPRATRPFKTWPGRSITRSISSLTTEPRRYAMTPEQEKINRWFSRNPWTHRTFFNRPHWTRRNFFELMGAGVTGSVLANRYARAADLSAAGATPKGTARNVIFILLAGAPSHTDTFDFKN